QGLEALLLSGLAVCGVFAAGSFDTPADCVFYDLRLLSFAVFLNQRPQNMRFNAIPMLVRYSVNQAFKV
ncbi:MAG TPA: hypothetical protein PKY99_07975, partial [Turneriella sp.]|nr:hypothetical protein [Turneriella sp.]